MAAKAMAVWYGLSLLCGATVDVVPWLAIWPKLVREALGTIGAAVAFRTGSSAVVVAAQQQICCTALNSRAASSAGPASESVQQSLYQASLSAECCGLAQ